MTNTFICRGTATGGNDRHHGDGMYAKKMGGGSVNPATGEFTLRHGRVSGSATAKLPIRYAARR
jgi:hypothetical protein